MRANLRFPAELVTFTEEILNGKLDFLRSVNFSCSDRFQHVGIGFNMFEILKDTLSRSVTHF